MVCEQTLTISQVEHRAIGRPKMGRDFDYARIYRTLNGLRQNFGRVVVVLTLVLNCRMFAQNGSGDKHSLRVVSRERIPLNMTTKMVDNPNYPASLFQDNSHDAANRSGKISEIRQESNVARS